MGGDGRDEGWGRVGVGWGGIDIGFVVDREKSLAAFQDPVVIGKRLTSLWTFFSKELLFSTLYVAKNKNKTKQTNKKAE